MYEVFCLISTSFYLEVYFALPLSAFTSVVYHRVTCPYLWFYDSFLSLLAVSKWWGWCCFLVVTGPSPSKDAYLLPIGIRDKPYVTVMRWNVELSKHIIFDTDQSVQQKDTVAAWFEDVFIIILHLYFNSGSVWFHIIFLHSTFIPKLTG